MPAARMVRSAPTGRRRPMSVRQLEQREPARRRARSDRARADECRRTRPPHSDDDGRWRWRRSAHRPLPRRRRRARWAGGCRCRRPPMRRAPRAARSVGQLARIAGRVGGWLRGDVATACGRSTPRRGARAHRSLHRRSLRHTLPPRMQRPRCRSWQGGLSGIAASVAVSTTSPMSTAASTPAEYAWPPAGKRPSTRSRRSGCTAAHQYRK